MNREELKRRGLVFTIIIALMIFVHIFDVLSGFNYSKYAGWINVFGLVTLLIYDILNFRKANTKEN